MSRVHIIACGESGALWDGKGLSLGVNDCEKFGKKVDYLLLLDSIGKFSPERLNTITSTRPKTCFSHRAKWADHFSNFKLIDIQRWNGPEIKPGVVYHSNTSPFGALSLSLVMGFSEAVLWGVDMISHHRFGKGRPGHEFERLRIEAFAKTLLEQHGFKTYLGAPGALNLPLWNSSTNS